MNPANATSESRELWIWAAVLIAAAWLRFYGLGDLALTPSEAAASTTPSLLATDRLPAATTFGGGSSPLLFQLQHWVFFLFGATHSTARVVPALAGTLMVASAWRWRDSLGPIGALALASLLAIDPFLVTVSRHAGPEALAVAIALWILSELQPSGDPASPLRLGLGVGLLAGCGPLGWAFLLLAGLVAVHHRSPPDAGEFWRVFGVTVAVTAGGVWGSWRATRLLGEGIDGWFASLGQGWIGRTLLGEGISWTSARQESLLLLATEPLLLAAASVGISLLVRRTETSDPPIDRPEARRVAPPPLGAWLVLGLLIASLHGGPATPLLWLLPIALVAAWAIAAITPQLIAQPGLRVVVVAFALAAGLLQLRSTLTVVRSGSDRWDREATLEGAPAGLHAAPSPDTFARTQTLDPSDE